MTGPLGLALVLAAATADDWTVKVEGCPELAPLLLQAIELELVDRPAKGPRIFALQLEGCADPEWVVTLHRGDEPLAGPETLKLGRYGTASRIRAAALWATSNHRSLPKRRNLEASRVRPQPARSLPLGIGVGLGAYGHRDPAELSTFAPFVRFGLSGPIASFFEVGGAVEGGALFEPFNHTQPWFRMCSEASFRIDLRPLRGSVGPRACVSASSHLRGGQDEWTSGLVLGGLARLELAVDERLWVGLRTDLEAWERDLFATLSPVLPEDPGSRVTLPWMGSLAMSVELRWDP